MVKGEKQTGYHCSICGQYHSELPLHYSVDAPEQWYQVAVEERDQRCELSTDQCIIDDKYFFVRGCIEIPVIGSQESFSWGVWVSLSEENYERMSELWYTEGRESEKPYFGWLCTTIPGYPDTMFLRSKVITRPVGERPLILLEESNHPLVLEQIEGITMRKVQEIAEMILHDD